MWPENNLEKATLTNHVALFVPCLAESAPDPAEGSSVPPGSFIRRLLDHLWKIQLECNNSIQSNSMDGILMI